jgi:MYXO-CTERM domain-containing protein
MGADTPAIMIANSDGTHVRALVPPTASGERLLATDAGANHGFDCSWMPGAVGTSAATAVLGLLVLALLALRPRRR